MLSDPTPKEARVDLSTGKSEDRQSSLNRYLAAKKVAIELHSALKQERWDTALEHMSQDTQNFLDDASSGSGAVGSLAKGMVSMAGQEVAFKPAEDFFIPNLVDLRDDFPGAKAEAETVNRKELYAIGETGEARKLVLIYEADAWKLHSPFLNSPLLPAQKP